MTPRLHVAIVVQRYGLEVHGGAETLARRVAELLAPDVDVTVLTTCALDYVTWANHYPPGPTNVAGVRVLRFPVSEPRDPAAFDRVSRAAYAAPEDAKLGRRWVRVQGPNAPGLLEHLRLEQARYDVVVFVTYLYATAVEGIPLVRERAVLVPTMHDEPPLAFGIFDELFAQPRLLMFLTEEERRLASGRFRGIDERARVVGMGVDEHEGDAARFRGKTGITRPYAVYVGRLDLSKGVGDLLVHHAAYRAARPEGLDLVLVGGGGIEVADHPFVHPLGFVAEDLKHDAVAGARVVLLPSPYESLSLAQLEAWSHGRPTLANAGSPVLVGQSRRAGGGLWYRDAAEYTAMLDLLATSAPLAESIGRQGRRYVARAHSWPQVRAGWLAALAHVAERRAVTRS